MAVRASESTRLSEEDWIDAAIQTLVRKSIEHVRVEPLAAELGVTKGSFYYHFRDRGALHDAILKRWTEVAGTVGRLQDAETEPELRLRQLLELPRRSKAAARSAEIELAIRGWARRSSHVRKAVDRVDAQRLDSIEALFAALGFASDERRARAFLAYAYVQLFAQVRLNGEAQRDALVDEAIRTLCAPSMNGKTLKTRTTTKKSRRAS